VSGEFQLKQGETLQGKDKLEFTKEVLKIRSDPVYFFSKIIYIDLFPKQEEIIRTFYQHKYDPNLLDYKKLIWGSGQRCCSPESLIETQNGLVSIKDLYKNNLKNEGNDSVLLDDVQVFNGEKFTPATHVFYTGKKPVYKLTTEYGFTLECSKDHKFLVFDGDGFDWKPLKDIKPGEFIQTHKNIEVTGTTKISQEIKDKLIVCNIENKKNHTLPLEITPELATLIGMLIADGSISGKGKIYYNKGDRELLDYYISGMKHQFNLDGSIYDYNDKYTAKTVELYCEQVRYFLELIGVSHWHSDTKEIPSCILQGTIELKKAFISGYFSGDGNAQVSKSNDAKKARVTATTVSKTLAYQLQNLLLELGILSSISIGKSAEYGTRIKRENDAYTLNIFGEEIINFYNTITLILPRKQKNYKKPVNTKN